MLSTVQFHNGRRTGNQQTVSEASNISGSHIKALWPHAVLLRIPGNLHGPASKFHPSTSSTTSVKTTTTARTISGRPLSGRHLVVAVGPFLADTSVYRYISIQIWQ